MTARSIHPSHDHPTPPDDPRSSLVRTLRDTWLIFRRSLSADPAPARLGRLRASSSRSSISSCSDRCSRARPGGPAPTTNAFNWFVPGLLIQMAMFGAAFAGFGLIAELRNGVVERMRVTPMSRVAMLLGRSLRDVDDPAGPGDPA